MNKNVRTKFFHWARIILLIYVLLGAALYFFQEKLLFHPVSLPEYYHYRFDIPTQEINLPVNKDKNLSIVQFTVPDSTCKGIVLYFHGNRQNINRYAAYAKNFTTNDYEVWMMDYPGFGKSTGTRSEDVLYDDALILYRMARARMTADSIIIYGKSIGTGIAAQLASVRDCKMLILETPYASIDALAQHYFPIYPFKQIYKYHLPVISYLQKVTAPVYIFHGRDDEIIPFSQSKKIVSTNPSATLIDIPEGKHNNLNDFPLFHQKLDAVLTQKQ